MLLLRRYTMSNTKAMSGIRLRRYEMGLTQKALAEKAGIAEYTVTAAETGKKLPRPRTAKALADALGCSVADVLENNQH
jgi:DNA-binding XRE family transcriptional regulator